ncbi:hypothetical protein MELE44368_08380 [Mycolicibacterium elephantis DSM 44368]|uniref:Uncharacterized protein n=1 Tax=Mycolicibacterium elephantis DSM 44368 TaxID=1335622 RepID=A0A439DMG2_9MYCO|nr:hypothetical protein MELE44368_08380 [Mycolicibacterium elephantis DSM 44368]
MNDGQVPMFEFVALQFLAVIRIVNKFAYNDVTWYRTHQPWLSVRSFFAPENAARGAAQNNIFGLPSL